MRDPDNEAEPAEGDAVTLAKTLAACDRAAEQVASWPAWKQQLSRAEPDPNYAPGHGLDALPPSVVQMVSDSDDLPTPEQVAAYLAATGWAVHPASESDPRGVRTWVRGDHLLHLDPRRIDAPLHLPDSTWHLMNALAYIEGRPTPAEQVRRDILERHRLGCGCGSPAGWHVSHGEAGRDE